MQNSLNVENTPACHHREHNVSGMTQASFIAKFKGTQNEFGQKRQHSVCVYTCVYIYIYIYIYIYPR